MSFRLQPLLLADVFVHDTYVEVSPIWFALLGALGVLFIAAIALAVWLAIRRRDEPSDFASEPCWWLADTRHDEFDDGATRVILFTSQEAQRFNHEYIGTEHILLGLLKEDAGFAAATFKHLALDAHTIRAAVERLIASGPDIDMPIELPPTRRAKLVIQYSMEEARNVNQRIATEHILLGLLREREGVAGEVLHNLGVTLHSVRDFLRMCHRTNETHPSA